MKFTYKKTLCTALSVVLAASLIGCGSVTASAANGTLLSAAVTSGTEQAGAPMT